ncbi:hypothetical protein [Lignipirellula cremea]|uniref:Uncharacterized protein n=1 Tax=Lignipirellula cremea TaxID=2528010 RepID=A0A518DYZ5_9BACT|nr:hypothetical protein [Lignipirellula cremea]QDU97021.1 hypothetical protein Pla8534_48460 [Lignipirellula cremea]
MIIPTPEFDPMYAHDGIPFEQKMIAYIDREFSDLLGPRRAWLQERGGLNKLAACYGSDRIDAPELRRAG